MPVNTTHLDYTSMVNRWIKCRDVVEGSTTIKSKRETYLPKVGAHKDDSNKYDAYLARALFYNAMRRTVEGLAGAIFQKGMTVQSTDNTAEELEDITLTNLSLETFALRMTNEVLTVGRYGVLVDIAGEESGKQRPFWLGYEAEDIISWKTERLDGDQILTRVVLQETVETQDPKDKFVIKSHAQYRVLELVDGKYQQGTWVKDQHGEFQETETRKITRRGEQLTFIPFVFVSPIGTVVSVQTPPLEDVADINISHYQTMADLEWGRHWTALPTPWAAGVKAPKDGTPLSMGSGVAWLLTEGGRAGMIEFSGAGLGALKVAEKDKRLMMATLGARLLEDQPSRPETVGAVSLRHSGEHATLRTIATAVDRALTTALVWHEWWSGTGEIEDHKKETDVDLNKDFFDVKAKSEDIKTLMLLWQSEAISYKTFYHGLMRGEWARPGIDFEMEIDDIRDDNDSDFPSREPSGETDPTSEKEPAITE